MFMGQQYRRIQPIAPAEIVRFFELPLVRPRARHYTLRPDHPSSF